MTLDIKGRPWSVRISFGNPTRLLKKEQFFCYLFSICLSSGNGFCILGGVVYKNQDVLVSAGTLWEGAHNIYRHPFKWGFYDLCSPTPWEPLAKRTSAILFPLFSLHPSLLPTSGCVLTAERWNNEVGEQGVVQWLYHYFLLPDTRGHFSLHSECKRELTWSPP